LFLFEVGEFLVITVVLCIEIIEAGPFHLATAGHTTHHAGGHTAHAGGHATHTRHATHAASEAAHLLHHLKKTLILFLKRQFQAIWFVKKVLLREMQFWQHQNRYGTGLKLTFPN
jgi:hypothetical protein